METKIYGAPHFWLIWTSCLGRPTSLKNMQILWGFKSNSLFQRGIKDKLWKEMISSGWLNLAGTEKSGKVSANLFSASFANLNEKTISEMFDKFPALPAFTDFFKIVLVKFNKPYISLLNQEKIKIALFNIEDIKTLYSGSPETLENFPMALLVLPALSFLFAFASPQEEAQILKVFAPVMLVSAGLKINMRDYFKSTRNKIRLLFPSKRATPKVVILIKEAIEKQSESSIKEMMKL